MQDFNAQFFIPLCLGLVFIIFAGKIDAFNQRMIKRLNPQGIIEVPAFIRLGTLRFIGLICLVFAARVAFSGSSGNIMNEDRNRIMLLGDGIIIKGEVTKKFYQTLAPEGWKIVYKFSAKDLKDDKERIFSGSVQGPKKYYGNLMPGDFVTISYYGNNPKINCEIRKLINDPNYRMTFYKAGKFELLKKFEQYGLESYDFKSWYHLQWEK
jgi:hypothetical protein